MPIEDLIVALGVRPATPADHSELSIRPATPADLASIESLLSANQLPTVGVADSLPDFAVAESNGRLVGVAGLERCGEEYALLRSAAVDAEWRGRGVGRRLVEGVIADARTRGLRTLYLLTTTAEKYFPTFGFAPISRDAVPAEVRGTAEFTDACPASATVMALPLETGVQGRVEAEGSN